MKIKNIKVDDIIQVFNYKTYALDLYKVLKIYRAQDNKKVFECKVARFDENKKIKVFIDCIDLVKEKDVMSIYKEIER